jgi:hypothetical protein
MHAYKEQKIIVIIVTAEDNLGVPPYPNSRKYFGISPVS